MIYIYERHGAYVGALQKTIEDDRLDEYTGRADIWPSRIVVEKTPHIDANSVYEYAIVENAELTANIEPANKVVQYGGYLIAKLISNLENLLASDEFISIYGHEHSAKTSFALWVEAGMESSPADPNIAAHRTKWINWRDGRDAVYAIYTTKKSYILDVARTYDELQLYDINIDIPE